MIQAMEHEHSPSKKNIYVLGFSGGKDSMASYLYLTRVLGLTVICVFADTGHESPELYEYLDLLEREYGFSIIRVKCTLGNFADEKELAPFRICGRLSLFEDEAINDEARLIDKTARELKVEKSSDMKAARAIVSRKRSALNKRGE